LFSEENGLRLLTKELGKTKFKKGREISNLKRLMRKYKEWSNNLYPQRFEAAIQKFEKLSGKMIVQTQLQNLRDERDGIRPPDPLVHSDDDIMQEIERKADLNPGKPDPPRPPPPSMMDDDIPPDDVLDEMMAEQEAFFQAPSKPIAFGANRPRLFGAAKKPFGAKKSSGLLFGAQKRPKLFGAKPAPKADDNVDRGKEVNELDAILEDIQ